MREVCVLGEHSAAVVKANSFAGRPLLCRKHDLAVINGADWRAIGRMEIKTGMAVTLNPINDSPFAKIIFVSPDHRKHKSLAPEARGAPLVGLNHLLEFAPRTGSDLGWWRAETPVKS